MDKQLITSVLGFDLNIEVVDQNGEVIKTGCKRSIYPKKPAKIKQRLFDKKFFTHYNDQLLAKIRDLRKFD